MSHLREISPTNSVTDSLFQRPLSELIFQANQIRKEFLGSEIELCSILNAKSGGCSEDCKFCAQSSRYPTNIDTFPLKDKDQIVEAARQAKEIGAKKFGIVTSGNSLSLREINIIAQAIREIRDKVDIEICASLGAQTEQQLRILKQAGLARYHHNVETSPRFYSQIVSTHSFEQRVNTIKAAKQVGLSVCSGGIIGMGESEQDRIDLACLLRDLDVDSVPINFLVAHPGTPLQGLIPLSCSEAVKTIAIFRIILKDKIIKIAAGRETILSDFQGLGFLAGANGMLIGGYLTIRGRDVAADQQLVEQIKMLWRE
ncbi:biotin synthase BioB [Candidatus Omnitrophota bacterium]